MFTGIIHIGESPRAQIGLEKNGEGIQGSKQNISGTSQNTHAHKHNTSVHNLHFNALES